jgi:mono/diheme cytochrome c family protein
MSAHRRFSLSLLLATVAACAGAEGPAGSKGVDGIDGVNGTNGDNGEDGAPGADGLAGVNGVDGVDGEDGVDWPGEVPVEYEAADGIIGGAAFSQWYSTPGGGLGALADYEVTVASDFTRCKACHGWDGLGSAGSYATRTGVSTGTSSRPDVASVNVRSTVITASFDQLFDLIDRPDGRTMNSPDSRHPDFSEDLTEEQVWDLIKFMREEWVNPNDLYDLTITGEPMHYEYDGDGTATLVSPSMSYTNIGQDGDPINGVAIYDASCATCHGADGKLNPPGGSASVGQFTRSKPYESWFKIKFGDPGKMDPGILTETTDLQDLYAALADDSLFPNL